MRRAGPALLATAGALGLLATFHSTPAKLTPSAASAAPPPPTSDPTTTTTAAPVTTRVTSPPTSAARPTTTAAPAAHVVTGSDIGTQFGDVQVQVLVRGTRLLDVRAIRLPYSHSRSQQLSDYAAPRLRSEALQAQSANIDLVSGATYTSEAYIQSLQSALDAARRA